MRQKFASTESVLNSTQTPLSADATFTGEWEDCRAYNAISFACKSDAACTLYVDFSSVPNPSTAESTLTYNVAANINTVHRLTITRPFFRIRIVNGSTNQTTLSTSVMKGDHNLLTAPLNLNVALDADGIVTRPNSFSDEAVIGRRTGVRVFTKFGYRDNLTAAAGEETVWAASGNFTPMTSADTFTITYNNATDGDGTTGALTLYIQYVDANGLAAESVHTLGNTGSDVTSFTGLGINRVAVSSSGSADYNTNNITITDTSGGTTQAFIPATQSVTQDLVYFTSSNAFAVGKYLWINANKLSGGGSPRITIKGYVYNRNVSTRFEIFRYTIDTNSENTTYISEPVGFRLSPTDVLYFVADTDTNSAIVNMRFSLIEYDND